ncbi:hypothetical protein PFISCL1PPCAC_12743, partial [Pristionchus fissidentatus]
QELSCLICASPITHSRLGVDSCRACAAFYKRASASEVALKCKGGDDVCLKRDPKSSCRKCRFKRFSEVLAKA